MSILVKNVLLEKKELVKNPQSVVFKDLMNPRKYSAFFDNTFLKTSNDDSIPEHFQFVATISRYEEFSYIQGKINSVKEDESFQELDFEWKLTRLQDTNETEIYYKIYIADETKRKIPIKTVVTYGGSTASLIALMYIGFGNMLSAYATAMPLSITALTTTKTGASVSTSTSTKALVGILATLVIGGGIFGGVYVSSSNALLEMENLITLANAQYENKQYDTSFDTFSKVDAIFLGTEFSPDHLEHAEYLHLQSLTGMGNSLQSQSNFGQIESFSKQSEEYYLYALAFYEGKHHAENAWIGRGINAIYETPEKTLEICAMFDSINSHMCQGEAYSYMYVIDKAPLEKAEEQFKIALNMAGSENQWVKIEKDISHIYNYYNLPGGLATNGFNDI